MFYQGLGVVILLSLIIVWRKELLAVIARFKSKPAAVAPAAGTPTQSVTLRVVDDIVNVTLLRDRLEDEGCEEGVTACTDLLRVIVEHQNRPAIKAKAEV
jgi:hypothetical protein